MKVKAALSAGFCYGVERAVKTVYEETEKGRKIYTYGPIVHNDLVVEELHEKGVSVIRDRDELMKKCEDGSLKGSTVIIRAHGIGDDEMKILEEQENVRIIDATCPFVKRIHTIVKEAYAAGNDIVITGDREHPEVRGILGCIENDAIVISSTEEALKIAQTNSSNCITIVSQTTFNAQKFKEIVEIFVNKLYITNVVNTICSATQTRQQEARALSAECDVMLVIGSSGSSNTMKLFDICKSLCRVTYLIQNLEELKKVTITNSVRCVGITAGASTPKNIIEEVLDYVRTQF
ncbi:MAG: 4-hydroxy-3-methylbut-2-enyl diphosphate reductase [Eubacteriales bacterium]|nr:4-hydroxy-3-methylbut-2-enyl diphosphate reductase [Eubacteriales bacterium]